MPEQGPLANLPACDDGAVLQPAEVAFIQSQVSIMVAAQGLNGQPVIARGIGSTAEADSGRIRIILRDNDATDLMAGAETHDQVAVTFTRPQTDVSMQVKGNAIAILPANPADVAVHRHYVPAMVAELLPLGFEASLIGCIVSDNGSSISILSFRPTQLFDQTPGPKAGQRRTLAQVTS